MRVPIRKPGQYTHSKPDRHITPSKLQEYKDELNKLERVIRPPAIAEVKRLADLGDFSENAEYQIAKGRLRGLNARILELEDAIKSVVVIKPGSSTGRIKIGSRVTVQMDGDQKTFQLLGSAESDPEKGIISHTSPIGAALMGKKEGNTFAIKIADKEVECTILKIE